MHKKISVKKSEPKSSYKMDELVLVFIVAAIAIVLGIIESGSKQTGMEAEKITFLLLDDHALSIANNGVVDKNKLQEIQNMDYEELKNNLNAKKDFCVYIEDENGGIILAKGSSKLDAEMPCNE